jgi:hypothetical protein
MNCGERVEDDFDVCWNCETQKGSLASESYFASPKSQPIIEEELSNGPKTWEYEACGAEVRFEDPTCPQCGADITEVVDSDEEAVIEEETAPIEKRKASSSATLPNQVSAVMKRYKDAYTVARVTNAFGGVIKATGIIIGGLLALIGFMVASSSGPRDPVSILGIAGIVVGIIAGALFFIIGVLVSAQGQILKASLDSAVNTSPFLMKEHRAQIMSLPES